MLRSLCVLAAAVAAAAIEDCGGAPTVEPKVCGHSGKTSAPAGTRCTSQSTLDEGMVVPVQVKIHNQANYITSAGKTVYVNGKLKAGASIQMAFTCLDEECKTAADDILQYTGTFVPSPQAAGVTFDMGREKGSGMNGHSRLFKATDATHKGGLGLCKGFANHATACGHLTITKDLPIPSHGYIGLGTIYMRVVKRMEQPFWVQVAATTGMLETTGGICETGDGSEYSGSGSGTARVLFKGVTPPKPKPTPTTGHMLSPKRTAKAGKGKGLFTKG